MKQLTHGSGSQQRGVVLLLLAMILFAAGAGWLISRLNAGQAALRQGNATVVAMNTAKERLIAYAVMHGDYYPATLVGPGHLPCPDTNGNGAENAPCAGSLGRLPQAFTLPSAAVMPLSDHNAAVDQQFWYALSNAFKRAPAGVANTTSVGTVTLDGQTGIAALIIAPGEAVGAQVRVNNAAANYLEAGNVAGPNFVTSNPVDPANFNDRILPVTINELMSPVTARVVEAMRALVINYQVMNGFYPTNAADFAVAMSAAPVWILGNNWLAVTTYTVLTPTTASIQFTACNIIYTLDYVAGSISKSGARC